MCVRSENELRCSKVGKKARYNDINSTVQYSTVQYSTVQYSTVQYSTVQYSAEQYSTVQYTPLPAPLDAITGTVTAACTACSNGMSYLIKKK